MAKVVILIEDKEDGNIDIQFTCDTPLPEDGSAPTQAQEFAGRLHESIAQVLASGGEFEEVTEGSSILPASVPKLIV